MKTCFCFIRQLCLTICYYISVWKTSTILLLCNTDCNHVVYKSDQLTNISIFFVEYSKTRVEFKNMSDTMISKH